LAASRPRLGQAPAGELEGWIGAQRAKVVAILIAAGDGKDAGAEHVRDGVRHAARIPSIWNDVRQPLGNPKPSLGLSEEQDATV
jgi:hypothetical protein